MQEKRMNRLLPPPECNELYYLFSLPSSPEEEEGAGVSYELLPAAEITEIGQLS